MHMSRLEVAKRYMRGASRAAAALVKRLREALSTANRDWVASLLERALSVVPAGAPRLLAWLRESRLRLVWSTYRLSTQLYGGLGAAVGVTLLASLVAWFSFDAVGDAQSRVNDESVPELAASFAVAQQSGGLAVAAPRLTGATTPDELAEVAEAVSDERYAFEISLAALTSRSGERYDQIRSQGGALISNIVAIEQSATERLVLSERNAALHERLTEIQNQLADGGATAEADIVIQVLINALQASDAALLGILRERFEANIDAMRANAAAGGNRAAIRAALSELGTGRQGAFELRAQELALAEREQAMLAGNRDYAESLLLEVENVVNATQLSASEATGVSEEAIATGRTLLIAINTISIAGSALIAWLFIGRLLLRRLQNLSDRMRAMADGDLEAEVDVDGRDEMADMAAALEVFRRHALEVQRLNLVETLAEELRGKNDQLETALDDLRRTQSQMVAREKLAGLGELAAGVAHEIKNPLNFMKNFSEASMELLEELRESLEGGGEESEEDRKQLIDEICEDLGGNLGRIQNHGARADGIVRGMLRMGATTSAERQPADINRLLTEHLRFALNNVREQHPDLKPEIEQDMDPHAGHIEIVAQDIARLFANLVGNACDAMAERQRTEDAAGSPYRPILSVTTRRLADRLEMSVRDNGGGMPPDVVEKIFNPFFTTKPTNQGTGLGLSLCNDIVHGHGGAIRVDTEHGSHTEMIVALPIASTPTVAPAME